jgi:hypothetical protein
MSELDKHLNDITKRYSAVLKKVNGDLKDKLDDADMGDIGVIVKAVWNKHDVPAEYRDALLDGVVRATATGLEDKGESALAFRGYYDNLFSMRGTELSKSIHDVTRTDEIEAMIKEGFRTEKTIKTLAVDLVDKDITQAELPKYIEDFLSAFRKAASLTDDSEAYAKYRKELSRIKSQIERLTAQDTSKLARGYKDIADLSLGASDKIIDSTIERAVMFKARANGLRLAHTETARAYGNARVDAALSDDDAIGIKVSLSGAHDKYCICDFFADTDMCRLGEGVFLKDELPEYPFHPYCTCLLDAIYMGDPDAEYDDEAAKEAFDDLEDDERRALVGKKGTWDDVEWDYHKLPKDYSEVVE